MSDTQIEGWQIFSLMVLGWAVGSGIWYGFYWLLGWLEGDTSK